jgi:hypothetical protein
MYNHLMFSARGIGKTEAVCKVAKEVGAIVACFSWAEAERLRRYYGVETVYVDNVEMFYGNRQPILYDADTVAYVVSKMQSKIDRLEEKLKAL